MLILLLILFFILITAIFILKNWYCQKKFNNTVMAIIYNCTCTQDNTQNNEQMYNCNLDLSYNVAGINYKLQNIKINSSEEYTTGSNIIIWYDDKNPTDIRLWYDQMLSPFTIVAQLIILIVITLLILGLYIIYRKFKH